MKTSALQGEAPAVVFADLDTQAACVFCGRQRPLELLATWLCTRCKRKSLFELFEAFRRRNAA